MQKLEHKCERCGLVITASLPSYLSVEVYRHEQYHAKKEVVRI